jgi:hypothetical protein
MPQSETESSLGTAETVSRIGYFSSVEEFRAVRK